MRLLCIERRRFSQTMASEWQTAFVVSHKMPWCAMLTAVKNYNKSLEKLQDLFFKTETKTKCSRPRTRPRLSFLSSRRLETKTLVSRTASLPSRIATKVLKNCNNLSSRPRPRLRPNVQDQDKTKTSWSKTKTKTFIFVLEAPRDQDPGLEDYVTVTLTQGTWKWVFKNLGFFLVF